MLEKMKLYLGLGPTEDYEALGKRARQMNFGLLALVILATVFVGNLWVRVVVFVVALVISIVVSLVSRDAEREQRPH